ncbi:hypothetical protein DFH09DRAFT_1138714 [Mycena vulgaris]|nr:hypothetical protein DFH09DRAFT_1138714 [Mycena vulgaris]
MNEILSQGFSLVAFALISFIPDVVWRYTAILLATLSLAAYFVHRHLPSSYLDRCEASLNDIDERLTKAVKECVGDPRFVAEAALRVTMLEHAISVLKIMNLKNTTWKQYPRHVRSLWREVFECQREMKELRTAILSALESALQDKHAYEIGQREAILASTFPEGQVGNLGRFRVQSSKMRQAHGEMSNV